MPVSTTARELDLVLRPIDRVAAGAGRGSRGAGDRHVELVAWRSERLRAIPRLAGIVVVALGVSVLTGWWLESPRLVSGVPGLVAMNPATAIAFLLAGLSLWLFQARRLRGQGSALWMDWRARTASYW